MLDILMTPRRREPSAGREASESVRALKLTRRERQIVALLGEGYSNKEIAAALGVSPQTVKNRLSAVYERAGVRNRLGLVMAVMRRKSGDG